MGKPERHSTVDTSRHYSNFRNKNTTTSGYLAYIRRQRASKLVFMPLASATPVTETSARNVCSTSSRLKGPVKLRRRPVFGGTATIDCSCLPMLVLSRSEIREHAAMCGQPKDALAGRLRLKRQRRASGTMLQPRSCRHPGGTVPAPWRALRRGPLRRNSPSLVQRHQKS